MTTSGSDVATRYLRALARFDWKEVASCLAPGVHRHGPYGDDYQGDAEYLAFLQRTMPSLPGYGMDIDNVTGLEDGRTMVELRETIETDSGSLVTHETLVFVVDSNGLLEDICIYIRQSPRS